MAGILGYNSGYDISPWNIPDNSQRGPTPFSQSALLNFFRAWGNNLVNPGPSVPTSQDQGGGGPLTNTARPDILAPTSNMQQPPSSQPAAATPQPQGPAMGPPLGLSPPTMGGYDLGTIGPGLDPGAGQQLPSTSTPTQGSPSPFANPFGGGGFISAMQDVLGPMNPQAYAVTYQRRLAQAQYNALMQDPNMTPGRAIAMIQSPQVLQNYYDTRQLGSVKNAAGEEVPVIASQGRVGALAGDNFMSGGMDKIQEKAAAEKRGEAQATTQQALPNAIIQAQQAVKLIDDISSDKNLPGVTGVVMGRNPGLTGDQTALIAKIDQLHGQAFLQAWQSLKGAGARITNTEAMKATDAIGRLQRTQGTEGFRAALNDLRGVITEVIQANQYLARGGQGQNYQPPQQSNVQPTYTQEDLVNEARRRGLIQ